MRPGVGRQSVDPQHHAAPRDPRRPAAGEHRDPFDRMLVAKAMEKGLRIVSSDRGLRALGVEVVWGRGHRSEDVFIVEIGARDGLFRLSF